jgi:hypothetical protein
MQITVQVSNVDLATVIHETEYGASQTLADAIAEQVAHDLRKDEEWNPLRKRVLDIQTEEIHEQIRPIVAAAITEPIQRTNEYGRPIGEAITLAELIAKEVKAYLTQPTGDNYSRNRIPRVQQFIAEAVDKALKAELAEVIKEEKAKVVAAVRAKAADLIATAVREGIGR